MADEVEIASTAAVEPEVVSTSAVTEVPVDETKTAEDHQALSLLEKIEAKLLFVETQIATEIKQVIDEIKSHL